MKHKNAKTLTVSFWATHRQMIKELEKVWRYNGRSPVVQRALEDAYNREFSAQEQPRIAQELADRREGGV